MIRTMEKTRAFFRPTNRSPISPNKIAPSGRIRNAARYTPNELISCNSLEASGKKHPPISGASSPYTAKSYLLNDRESTGKISSTNACYSCCDEMDSTFRVKPAKVRASCPYNVVIVVKMTMELLSSMKQHHSRSNKVKESLCLSRT